MRYVILSIERWLSIARLVIDEDDDAEREWTDTVDWRLTCAPYCSRTCTTSTWPASEAMCRLVLPFYTHTHAHTHAWASEMAAGCGSGPPSLSSKGAGWPGPPSLLHYVVAIALTRQFRSQTPWQLHRQHCVTIYILLERYISHFSLHQQRHTCSCIAEFACSTRCASILYAI